MPRHGSNVFSRLKEALPFSAAVMMVSMGLVWAAQEASEQRSTFSYDPAGHRDPFVPLVRDGRLMGVAPPGSKMSTDKPVLYGILWDPGGHSLALINDAEVKVGDSISGYRVQEITQNTVVLSSGGVPVVLEIAFEAPPSKFPPGATTGGEGR